MNRVLWSSCPYCDSAHVEEDLSIVKCLDCGMGKYKVGRQKNHRKLMVPKLIRKAG